MNTCRVGTAPVHISEASRQLGVSPEHLRNLERRGRIPQVRRDHNGRIYTAFDIALLRNLGVGSRPRRLKHVEEVLEAAL
jgi:DNA-binding transcriptional MerR regulator